MRSSFENRIDDSYVPLASVKVSERGVVDFLSILLARPDQTDVIVDIKVKTQADGTRLIMSQQASYERLSSVLSDFGFEVLR
ncbi:MAG: hypothetical protein ACD_28C00005G0004 [uncultured bacterium]|nr:MAG: hypothetical protein ACD_28C00005G0004 [uncultured bacterium]